MYDGKHEAIISEELFQKAASNAANIIYQLYHIKTGHYAFTYNEEKGVSATATGVIYSKDGYVITNDHIYDGVVSAKFKIYTHDNKMYSAEYVAGDTRSDLAVLKITNAKNVSFKAVVVALSPMT